MTSITVRDDVKRELESLKPASLTWNAFFPILVGSIDPERLEQLLEARHREDVGGALGRARARYEAASEARDALLSAEEAREVVRRL